MAEHTHGSGTFLEYSTNNGSNWTALGEFVNITPPSKKRTPSPDTNLEATDRVLKKTPGMKDPGESKFKLYFTKAQFATLNGFWDSGTELDWRIKFPLIGAETNNTIVGPWKGWVMAIDWDSIETESDDKIKCEFTLQNNSIPGFTAGT